MDIKKWLDMLPVLKDDKDPSKAAVIGFLTGSVGLSVYLRSFIDALVPFVVFLAVLIASEQAAAFGWLLGAIVSGVYGYARVQNSNTRRATQPSSR
jgi:Na+/H+-translocating membrane pyrophosphatase